MKKRTHITPSELDFAFERGLITEEDYSEFWPEWWYASQPKRTKIINRLLSEKIELPVLPKRGKLTKSRKVAEREAKQMGGRVVRKDRFGKFNSRGRTFQAVRIGKKSIKKTAKRGKK